MGEHIGGGDGSAEQEREKLSFVLQEVGDETYLASSRSELIFPVDRYEVRWLEVLADNQDGVTVYQALDETDDVSFSSFVLYREARTSVSRKLNDLFGREVLQVTQPADEELLHVAPDMVLDYDKWHHRGFKDHHLEPIYGHPSTLDTLGVEALLKLKGFTKDNPASPEDRLAAESQVNACFRRNPYPKEYSYYRSFTEHNPVLAAIMHSEMKHVRPNTIREDLDWMTQGKCIGADTAHFSSPYKRDMHKGKTYCAECPVAEHCHDYAVRSKAKGGLWGGGDAKERRDKEFTANVGRVVAGIENVLPEGFRERRQHIAGEVARWLRLYLDNPDQSALMEAQFPAFKSLVGHFEVEHENPDGFLAMPTGTGKTALFIEAIRAAGLRTVVLVPTQHLVHQTVREFGKFHSEGDVGMIYADEKQTDRDITVTTYASFVRHVTQRTGLFSPEDIELLILDEAHKLLSSRNKELLGALEHILKIGLTATDEYDDEKTLKKVLPNEIYRMEIQEGIDTGLITSYQTLLAYTDTDMSRVRISPSTKDYVEKDLSEAVNNLYRNELAADLYVRYFRGEKAVFFCASIKHAQAMAAQLREMGVRGEAIYGRLPQHKKKRILESHKSPSGKEALEVICCTNNLLAEGWDNPLAAVCFNLAPTLSKVVSRQRAGRALRKDKTSPEKVAVVVDFVDSGHRRSPVIFADPEVAKKAIYFPGGVTDTGKLRTLDQEGIITDPVEIETIAYEMNTQRRIAAGLAPHDWLPMPALVRSAIRRAKAEDKWLADIVESIYADTGDGAHQFTNELIARVSQKYPGGYRQVWESDHSLSIFFSPEAGEEIIEAVSSMVKRLYGGTNATPRTQ